MLLYRAHVERVAFKTDNIEAGGLDSQDDGREGFISPRVRESGQIGIHLHDHVSYPHLWTEIPQRMLRRRHEFDKVH